MKLSIKNAVLAALAVGGVTAGTVAQAVDIPSTGNGSLVLFVTNTATNKVYARDLGLHVNDLMTEGTAPGQIADPSFGATNTVNVSIGPISADQTLTDFLATGSASAFTWNLLGGDSVGTTLAAPRRFVTTTPADLMTLAPPSNAALGTLGTSENNFFNGLTNTLGASTSVVADIGNAAGQIDINLVNHHFNQSPQTTSGTLDTSLNFFLLTSNTGSAAIGAKVFALNDLTLSSAGLLSSASVGEVPVPAAIWLFGSGLMGLLGIGRRRQAAAPAAA